MSYRRFDPDDIVISSDAVSSPAWNSNTATLGASTMHTSSTQVAGDSGKYYYSLYFTTSFVDSNIQYTVGYGDVDGSGSVYYNPTTVGYSPTCTVYKQARNLILGTEESDFTFGTYTPKNIYFINLQRSRLKEKILPGTLTLKLSTSAANTITLTDNSQVVTTNTYTDAGRVFELVSGSNGTVHTGTDTNGYTPGSGSYGKILPDVGLIVLNPAALDGTIAQGGISLGTSRTANTNDLNNRTIYNALKAGGNFTLRTEETLSSNYIFVRARNSEFNYSSNPSNITGSGELRHSVMIDSPQAYITAIGLYNDNNDLLAVAKLSKPLLKDFTKESLVRIKLDY
jgi:hypothetical protein